MIQNPLLRTIVKAMSPFIFTFALYIHFNGDYSPGGGFQAGVILASAFLLYGIVFNPSVVLKAVSCDTMIKIGALGVLIYVGTGFATVLLGCNFLEYKCLMPVAGNAPAAHRLGIGLVEAGVGLAVTSAMLIMYFSFATRKRS